MEPDSVPDDTMLRKTSLRLTDALYRAVEDEAKRQGVHAAQLWRDVMVAYLAYEAGRRGDDADLRRTIRELVEAEREERGL